MELHIEKVLDEDRLLRTVRYLDPHHVREDMTATPLAFKLRKNKNETYLSADIERLTTYEKSLGDPTYFRLFKLIVKEVRNIGCECVHLPEPDNYAHAGITGDITNSTASRLAKCSIFINFPTK